MGVRPLRKLENKTTFIQMFQLLLGGYLSVKEDKFIYYIPRDIFCGLLMLEQLACHSEKTELLR